MLTINGFPNNGYTTNDMVFKKPPQSNIISTTTSSGHKASALVDSSTLWPAGSSGTIVIRFTEDSGAWSYVGTDSNGTGQYPSMEYGFLDPPLEPFQWYTKHPTMVNATVLTMYTPDEYSHRNGCSGTVCSPRFKPGAVILHEFLHSLGALHEHQNTKSEPLNLNTGNIYAYYCNGNQNPPNPSECRSDADFNVLSTMVCRNTTTGQYTQECTSLSNYDPDSIMLYALYDQWFNNYGSPNFVNPTKMNFTLSESDKAWLKQVYPITRPVDQWPTISVSFLNGEPWKQAWVQKVVTEELAPHVGIRYLWPNMPEKNPSGLPPAATTVTDVKDMQGTVTIDDDGEVVFVTSSPRVTTGSTHGSTTVGSDGHVYMFGMRIELFIGICILGSMFLITCFVYFIKGLQDVIKSHKKAP